MRYLGVDYGVKRVGVAVSDERARLAFPEAVISNRGSEAAAEEVAKIAEKKGAGAIVIGRSLAYDRTENPMMAEVRLFAEALRRLAPSLQIFYEDETLTSAEAARLQGEEAKLDASAAALILKSYIERLSRRGVQ